MLPARADSPNLPDLALLDAVVDSLSEGVVVRDRDSRLLLCNAAAERVMGLSAADLAHFPVMPAGWTIVDDAGEPMSPGDSAAAVCLRTGRAVRDMPTGVRRPDGSELWLSVNARPLPADERGTPSGVVISFTDVTAARRLGAERERLRTRLQRVTALRLGAATAMAGATSRDDLVRRTCAAAVEEGGFTLCWIGMPDRAAGIVRPIAASGTTSYLDDVVVTLADEDPRSHGPTGTALRERRPIVNRRIDTDAAMAPWRERALHHGFGASAAFPLPLEDDTGVLCVYAPEPDFFNAEETRLLHQFAEDLALALREAAGRELLRTIAQHMGEGLVAAHRDGRVSYVNEAALRLLRRREEDVVGRPLHDVVHPAAGRTVPCTVETCGLLAALGTGRDARRDDDDFGRGDGSTLAVSFTATAVDQTPDSGTILVFSDATQRRREAQQIRDELSRVRGAARIQEALADGRLVLHAQPIIELAGGRTVQHELLLRMVGDDGALVPPAAFLPVAEACGLMLRVDRWVVAEAARLAHAGHPIEFNLSSASLDDPAMLAYIEERFRGAPGAVVCEVTETAVVTDRDRAERFLSRLAEVGIAVALDDFGSGYGGFSYFKTFPATYLKIDAEFVGDVEVHPASRHVVEAIVALARASGKQTVAEGVETERQLTLLTELGVDLAQGYLIGRPAPADEVLARSPANGA